MLAEALSARMGARFVADNRAGAAGTIGAAHVAQQPADGYTLVLSNTAPIVERLRAETFAVLAIPEVR